MGVPNNIQNGDVPDAVPLMANFNYLGDGKGVRQGTFNELTVFAASAPGTPFLCWATDQKQLLFYCGDTSMGNAGFILVAGG